GLQLVLATNSDTYSPGATVPIYARLSGATAGSEGNDVVPCVTLQQPQPVPAPAAVPQQNHGSAGEAPGAPGPAPASPIAVATAAPASADGSASSKQSAAGPVLTLTIPSGVAHGTHLRLVAFIPAYAKGNTTGKDLQVTLDITVR
ncbi:MAG TPA: hypothetical protein VH134_00160, partial [Candidatus Dormibacteraeota bacterium]|nr:hypothetical protein [Candidatus Dormibacteraeota bacterium]